MSKTNEELALKLQQSGADIKPTSVVGAIKNWFYGGNGKEGKFPNIAQLAGSEEKAKRLFVACMVYITSRPQLMACDPKSLQSCIMQCATLNLLPGVMNQCDFLVFKNVATFCPGYQGIAQLAVQGGTITNVSAQVVYSNDKFDYEEGTENRISFKKFLGDYKDRGERVCAFAIATLANGGSKFEIITKSQWEAVKAKSKGANSEYSPWSMAEKDPFAFDWMIRKTAVKQLCKLIPKSADDMKLAKAIALDNAAEVPNPSDMTLNLPTFEEEMFEGD